MADIILYNGIVHSLNPAQPQVEGIAISGSWILGVGSSAEIRSAYSAKREIDLHRISVFPG
jgi:predicted amidohydrolase YtcJ